MSSIYKLTTRESAGSTPQLDDTTSTNTVQPYIRNQLPSCILVLRDIPLKDVPGELTMADQSDKGMIYIAAAQITPPDDSVEDASGDQEQPEFIRFCENISELPGKWPEDTIVDILAIPKPFLSRASALVDTIGPQQLAHQNALARVIPDYIASAKSAIKGYNDISVFCQPLDRLILSSVQIQLGNRMAANATPGKRRLISALAYIDDNIQIGELDARMVANAVNISERQLHRTFSSANLSVASEIRQRRLSLVYDQLIKNPQMKITNIAMSAGYLSLATFYRQFKKHFGLTAKEVQQMFIAS
jgi:AraC-like DNA-binding protein